MILCQFGAATGAGLSDLMETLQHDKSHAGTLKKLKKLRE